MNREAGADPEECFRVTLATRAPGRKGSIMMKTISLVLALGAVMLTSSAVMASSADNGRRIAQARCSMCHIPGLVRRDDLPNSPPFALIAQKYDADMLVYAILDPHPRMNLRVTRPEAEDLAAYIHSLAR